MSFSVAVFCQEKEHRMGKGCAGLFRKEEPRETSGRSKMVSRDDPHTELRREHFLQYSTGQMQP